ncbi:MAG: nuclear transport factor 2 family protein [Novosphingobium sp.]|nr:nuclear transport factor 2 family protein [Novosphingobium sp.]MCP5388363.1 nuclear transport factor 2 family protein [Novosphingobium sp.]
MSDDSLAQRIRRLEALREIDDLIADLGRAFDGGPSADQLRQLFTEDALFVVDRYGVLEGCDGIADGVAGNAETGFRWTLHYLASPRVALGDDAATAAVDFYLWEIATAASGKAYWIGGRYEAQAVAAVDRWRFSRLELKADIISHYPEGWNPKPENLADA